MSKCPQNWLRSIMCILLEINCVIKNRSGGTCLCDNCTIFVMVTCREEAIPHHFRALRWLDVAFNNGKGIGKNRPRAAMSTSRQDGELKITLQTTNQHSHSYFELFYPEQARLFRQHIIFHCFLVTWNRKKTVSRQQFFISQFWHGNREISCTFTRPR